MLADHQSSDQPRVGPRRRRHWWVVLHRYAGLYMAVILAIAGLTGAALAFDQQINDWLNPEIMRVPVQDRPMLDPLTLRERALAIEPRARIDAVPINYAPGEVVCFILEPKIDPTTGTPYRLDDQLLYLNPYTGAEVGREKDFGAWPVTRRSLTRSLFVLHEGSFAGTLGAKLFGIAVLVWTVDCFVALVLTFPLPVSGPPTADRATGGPASWWSRWWPSWKFAWRGKPYRILFNLHRAGGLWFWAVVLVFATSSVCFNLPEVYRPVMKAFFGVRDTLDAIPDLAQPAPDPALGWRAAETIGQRLAREQAKLRGITLKATYGLLYFQYDPVKRLFGYPVHCDRDVGFHLPGMTVFFDGKTGALRAVDLASGANIGTTFTSWVSALHGADFQSPAIHAGVGITGLLVTMLSVTGIYLWWKKRRARVGARVRHVV